MHPIFVRQLKRVLPGFRDEADIAARSGELRTFLEHHAAPPELLALADGLPDLCARVDASFAQFERDLELKSRSLRLSSSELLGINEDLRTALSNREAAIGQLQAIARRLDQPDSDNTGEDNDLDTLIQRISELVAARQQQHTEILALHTELANQRFAFDQHAIFSVNDRDGNITYANDLFCEISGYSREELLGANFRIVDSAYHPPSFFAEILTTISSGKIWRGEVRNKRKNGEIYWVNATVVPLLDLDGFPDRYFSIRTDITERKRIEHDLMLAKDAAETANRAKTEFLSSISHELRTPLNAILGFAQLLQAEALSACQNESLDEIVSAGQHLLELINEVLDLARIESGRLDLTPEPLFMSEMIDECVHLIQPLADKQQITVPIGIACHVADNTGCCVCPVFADKLRLRQVLLNLLSNAIKYNRPDGRVEITCDGTDDQAYVTVTDTGRGIAEELQGRLFRPFERLESSPYEAGVEGTGIGLALSKQLIEAMGGRIGMHSTLDSGSTFWISLPKATPDGQSNNNSPASSPAPKPAPAPATDSIMHPDTTHSLLYIEDNPANLRLMQKIAALLPHLTLLEAPTAEIGLALAEACRPDLVLMDINLPGMNGFEALRCLRDNPATRHIPVVAVSANAMQRDIDNAREAGFEDYLTKPLDIPRLLALVRSLIGPPD